MRPAADNGDGFTFAHNCVIIKQLHCVFTCRNLGSEESNCLQEVLALEGAYQGPFLPIDKASPSHPVCLIKQGHIIELALLSWGL